MGNKRRRNKPEKPRQVILTFSMGDVMATSLEIVAGQLIFRNAEGKQVAPKSGMIRNQYEREKGPKILSASPLKMDAALHYSPDYALIPYDCIMAIDSNTRSIQGVDVSVAAIMACRWRNRELPMPIADVGPTQAIELRQVKYHPDLIAWVHLLKGVGANPEFDKHGKLALIVDSHLGNIEAIQNRKMPILGDFFLPEWATLFYASDAAADSFVNKVLRQADKHATGLLDEIERRPILPDSNLQHNDELAGYMHLWTFQGPLD